MEKGINPMSHFFLLAFALILFCQQSIALEICDHWLLPKNQAIA